VSTLQIPTKDLNFPTSLKMAVEGSCSTINYKSQPVIQLRDETVDITDALVCSLDNYDLFLGMPYLTTHTNSIKDCGNSIILFPKKGISLTCRKGNNVQFSAMSTSDTPDFIGDFPDFPLANKIIELPPLSQIYHHLNLIKGKRAPSPKMLRVPDKIVSAYSQIM